MRLSSMQSMHGGDCSSQGGNTNLTPGLYPDQAILTWPRSIFLPGCPDTLAWIDLGFSCILASRQPSVSWQKFVSRQKFVSWQKDSTPIQAKVIQSKKAMYIHVMHTRAGTGPGPGYEKSAPVQNVAMRLSSMQTERLIAIWQILWFPGFSLNK